MLTALMFVGSIVVAAMLIVRIPADFLTRDSAAEPVVDHRFLAGRPVLRALFVLLKNVFGLWIFILGIVMLVTPGQGLLFLFLGLTLLDFPGKQRLVRRLLKRPGVLKMVNKIRERAQRPPLEVHRS